ncbi:VOC family protein [Luteipulveratus mongoliensis]|uniref:VOC family protein n=1 Tax=Luteipulveratus mongoliensis TaxID=571913 RepID=UPI001C54C070|nr:VOC family protein [Luteipulveratus mongoliensis]
MESLQPDPSAAEEFYGALLGWNFDEANPDGYRVARLGGQRVAGIGQAPAMLDRGAWATYVLVADVEATVAAVVAAGGGVLFGPTGGDERTALLADPSGAPFGVRQGRTPLVADLVDVPGAWQMSSLHSPDPAVAELFYSAVFGWRLEQAPGGIALWRLAGSTRRVDDPTLPDDVIAVATAIEPGTPVPPHWAVNVRVADADAVAARVSELGGGLLLPPTDAPGFRNAVLADPAGGVLAVSQRVG